MSGLSDAQRGALKSCLEEIYFGYGEKDWERLAGEATDRIASVCGEEGVMSDYIKDVLKDAIEEELSLGGDAGTVMARIGEVLSEEGYRVVAL